MRRPGGVRRRPTALENALGNPGKRAHSVEPTPPPASAQTLIPPPYLDEIAVAEWDRIAPMLARLGLLTDADHTALAAYCQTVSTYVLCQRVLREQGLTNGHGKSRGEAVIAAKCLSEIRAFSAEFGLTPSSRARLDMAALLPGDDAEEELEELLSTPQTGDQLVQ